MAHNTSEYNFAYNEGGLLKFVWKNMFVSKDNSRNNRNTYDNQNDANGLESSKDCQECVGCV